jgi:hypothetical protein
LIEGAMRKFLFLIVLILTTIFVAGCGVLAFRNPWPFADSTASKIPTIIPEQPVVFGAVCGPFWFQ